MANCTGGCIADYLCNGGPTLPIDGASLAPYVKMTVDGKIKISVGNESDPDNQNTAVIKSFQFGTSNGAGTTLEILDEKGGDFERAMDALNKCITSSSRDYRMYVEFGWIILDCDGSVKMKKSTKPFYFIPLQIEANYTEGKIKFNITGSSLLEPVFEARQNETFPKMSLKKAIRKLFLEHEPVIASVSFLRRTPQGQDVEWNFASDGTWGPDGPEVERNASNQNKLAVAMEWIGPYLTDQRKGIRPTWNETTPGGEVIFWEDPESDPCFGSNDCLRSIGTYLVNGGSCLEGTSTVLTPDGWVRIDQLVRFRYSGLVLSCSDDGALVWSKVTNWYRTPRGNRTLHKVRLSGSRRHYKNTCGAILTNDHEILTNHGYVRLDQLRKDDLIHSGTLMPGGYCHEAVIGMILGDGHISKKSNRFEVIHCNKQLPYITHKADILGAQIKQKGKQWKFSKIASPYWRDMRSKFYAETGKKIITKENLREFSIISLAYLFMDDGSTCFRVRRKARSEIAICNFSKEEAELLAEKICELGVQCYTRPNSRWVRIFFNPENTTKLSRLIAPYVVPSMAYKLLPEDRTLCGSKLLMEKYSPYFSKFEIIPWKGKWTAKTVYCLGVEGNNNFVTQSGVVHNCSPVISFTPTAKWVYGALHANSGGAGGPLNNSTIPNHPLPCLGKATDSNSGTQTTNPTNAEARDTYGKDFPKKAEAAYAKHEKANKRIYAMEAELRLQGDPELAGISKTFGATVSLVVINPFHLSGSGCGDWTAQPGCNPVYSNKSWWIKGIDHSIKEGSYVTTLRLVLAAPGSDIDPDSVFGGPGSGGWSPPTKCGT